MLLLKRNFSLAKNAPFLQKFSFSIHPGVEMLLTMNFPKGGIFATAPLRWLVQVVVRSGGSEGGK